MASTQARKRWRAEPSSCHQGAADAPPPAAAAAAGEPEGAQPEGEGGEEACVHMAVSCRGARVGIAYYDAAAGEVGAVHQ